MYNTTLNYEYLCITGKNYLLSESDKQLGESTVLY